MEHHRKLVNRIQYVHTTEFHNQKAAKEILPHVFDLVNPVSVIDIGCGTGSWLAVAKKLGVQKVRGVDGIYVDDSLFEIAFEEFTQHDLTLPLDLGQKYDLAISLEVAEHLPANSANTFVDTLTSHSNLILFSAAIPGQGGQHHYNEQWPSYWQEKFSKKNYYAFDILRDKLWNSDKIDWWYKQNIILFAKKEYSTVLGPPTKQIISKVHPELFNLKVHNHPIGNKRKSKKLNNPSLLSLISRIQNKWKSINQ